MELNTLKLLTYTPTEALLMIGNESLGLSMSPSNTVVENVLGVSGKLTEITVRGHYDGSKPINVDSIANPYEGSTTFLINRLDLTEIFGALFPVDVSYPVTVKDVLGAISANTKIQFDEHDFADDRIDTQNFVLTPLPTSRRWIGVLNIVLTASGPQ